MNLSWITLTLRTLFSEESKFKDLIQNGTRYIIKQNSEYMSEAYRRWQSWTRRLGRAELGTKKRLWYCELPGSPHSCSVYAPSSIESDEDDFEYGALIDRAD